MSRAAENRASQTSNSKEGKNESLLWRYRQKTAAYIRTYDRTLAIREAQESFKNAILGLSPYELIASLGSPELPTSKYHRLKSKTKDGSGVHRRPVSVIMPSKLKLGSAASMLMIGL